MKRHIGWIMLFVGLGSSYAQLNESDTLKLQAKLTSSGSYLDGIVNRMLLINKMELLYANKKIGLSTRTDYQFGKTFYKQTENDWLSYNFFYLFPTHRMYPYAMLLLETNYRREIEHRIQPGLGVSYNVIHHNANHLLKLSLTGSYERSAYSGRKFDNRTDTTSNIIETPRVTGRVYGRHKLKGKLRFVYEFWFQQSVTEVENYRYHTEEMLEWPLTKYISIRTSLKYTYEHVELLGKKPYDLFWTYGISVSNF